MQTLQVFVLPPTFLRQVFGNHDNTQLDIQQKHAELCAYSMNHKPQNFILRLRQSSVCDVWWYFEHPGLVV